MLAAAMISQHTVFQTPLDQAEYGADRDQLKRSCLNHLLGIFEQNCPSSIDKNCQLSRRGDHLIFGLQARLTPTPQQIEQLEQVLTENAAPFTIELRLIQGWPNEQHAKSPHTSELIPDAEVKALNSPAAASFYRLYNLQRLDAELPAGVTILRQQCLEYSARSNHTFFIVLDVAAPQKLLSQLTTWAREFRERNGITVILQPDTSLARAREEFREIAGAGLKLTQAHRAELHQLIENFHGCTPPAPSDATPAPNFDGLINRGAHFVCIDSTNVKYREDAVAVERLSNGGLRVSVAFPDLTWFMQPHDAIDRYHQRAAFSIYGNGTVIPALGGYSAEGYGSFAVGAPQRAWVVRFDISKSGSVTNRDVGLEVVTIAEALDFSTADDSIATKGLDGLGDAYRAAMRLRNPRLRTAHFVRNGPGGALDNQSRVLVEELMIQAKHTVASRLADAGSCAGFRVYQAPSEEESYELFDRLREHGISIIKPQSFSCQNFLDALILLQEKGAQRLIGELVDSFIYRRHYGIHPGEHFGLGIHPYTELKSRDAISFAVQWNLRAQLCGDVEAISRQEMVERVSHHNERSRMQPSETLRLITASMLSEKLGFSGRNFTAIVSRIESDTAEHQRVLNVDLGPWFKRLGRIELSDTSLRAAGFKRGHKFKVGERVLITLKEFDLDSEQFSFDLRAD